MSGLRCSLHTIDAGPPEKRPPKSNTREPGNPQRPLDSKDSKDLKDCKDTKDESHCFSVLAVLEVLEVLAVLEVLGFGLLPRRLLPPAHSPCGNPRPCRSRCPRRRRPASSTGTGCRRGGGSRCPRCGPTRRGSASGAWHGRTQAQHGLPERTSQCPCSSPTAAARGAGEAIQILESRAFPRFCVPGRLTC